jgi:hypothetical protein
MNPNSETGWWIANLLFGAQSPGSHGPDDRLLSVKQVMVSVRCEHWREAFWKARRMGFDLAGPETISRDVDGVPTSCEAIWQFVGITNLVALPDGLADHSVIGDTKSPRNWLSLRQLSECILEDYLLEREMGEKRSGDWYRTMDPSDSTGI